MTYVATAKIIVRQPETTVLINYVEDGVEGGHTLITSNIFRVLDCLREYQAVVISIETPLEEPHGLEFKPKW